MDVSTQNAVSEIHGWLQENVTGSREISEDEPLIENGLLTSLQTVELVMFMEDKFGIMIEDEELNEENFASTRAIAELVSSKTS
jgi:methoxymalonate biosynthesis acyl carrier protein